jgi:hypothetical protein
MAILVGKTVLPTRNVPFHGADLIKQPLPQAVAGSGEWISRMANFREELIKNK